MTRCCLVIFGRPSVGQPTGRWEGVSSWMTNAQISGYRLLRFPGRNTYTRESPPVENPTCAAFEEYGEVPETVHLDFKEDDLTWIASKLSITTGVLGAEAIELRNWLLRFGCTSEDLRVIFARLSDLMVNSPPPPPWAAYRALMDASR